MTEKEFETIMHGIAKSWMDGDAILAAAYFHADAVYEEPPKQQFYRGRVNILEFFQAVMSGGPALTMIWRNLALDAAAGVGFGEYTFARRMQFHGIVVIQFQDGLVYRWREYQYQSDLNWVDFTAESEFSTASLK